MTLKLKRTPGLYLVGFMCSGKTTVGQALAEELGWCFVDLDQEIEKEQNKTVREIFAERGEPAFRELERDMLRRHVALIEAGNPCVLAMGGGAFVQPRNWELIENNGVTVWLDCPLDAISLRLGKDDPTRPLSADREAMKRMYEERKPVYARADYRVDAGCNDPLKVMRQILNLPIF
jgi:shikimate kinase